MIKQVKELKLSSRNRHCLQVGSIACNVCYTGTPEFFAEDEDGNSFVKKQPTTSEEEALCKEQMDACPVASIGNNGL